MSSPTRRDTGESGNGGPGGGVPYYSMADTEDFPEPMSPMTQHDGDGDEDDEGAEDRPPVPEVQAPWQAVWNDEERNYYYWNSETNETSWDPPEAE